MKKTIYKNKINGYIKVISCAILILSMGIGNCTETFATNAAAKAAEDKKKAEESLKAANQAVDNISQEKSSAVSQVNQMGSELSSLLGIIQVLEADIEHKKEEIDKAQKEYDIAKQVEQKQYEDMKKRMKYMYEAGKTQYLDILMKAKSLTDFLNRSEYAKELHTYDRNMLTDYQETKQQVLDLKTQLEEEYAEMEVMEEEYLAEKANLEKMIAVKRREVSNFEAQLAEAQKAADTYAKEVKEQTEKLRKIQEEERRKAEEAARKKAEEEAKKKSVSPSKNTKKQTVKSTGGTANGRAIADYALQFVGNPYVYGGTSLTNGTDCSGFTQGVYRHFGITLPRTTSEQISWGVGVDVSDMQAGDLVFYAGHVAIYIGGNQIVHASSAKTGIKVSSVYYRAILGVRRAG